MLNLYRTVNFVVFGFTLLLLIDHWRTFTRELDRGEPESWFVILVLIYSTKCLFDLFFRYSDDNQTLINLWIKAKKSELKKRAG